MTEQEKERQSVRKTFKGEIAKIKSLPGFKAKIGYFFDYYTMHLVVLIVAIVLIVSIVSTYMNRKDDALFGIVLNLSCVDTENFCNELDKALELGPKEECIMERGLFLSQYGNGAEQKIVMYVAAHQLDYVITDEVGLSHFGNQHFWKDLRDFLPADLYEDLKDDIIVRTFTKKDEETGESVTKEQTVLRISDYKISQDLKFYGYDEESPFYLGAFMYPPNEENVIKFFYYIRDCGKVEPPAETTAAAAE